MADTKEERKKLIASTREVSPRQQFNTYLPPDQEASFRDWADKTGKAGDLNDYDLRGYYQSVGGKPAETAEGVHLVDTFKKPNHPTFSDQSQYHITSGAIGGTWTPTPVEDQYTFNVGATNNYPDLQGYFNKYEKGTELVDKRKKLIADIRTTK